MCRKYYFISKLETNNIDRLDNDTVVIYRNYDQQVPLKQVILNIKNYCKKKK